MSVDAKLFSLIDGAYRAAVEPAHWYPWAVKVAELLDGTCCSLSIVHQAGRLDYQTIWHKNMKVVERYIDEQIGRFDPQVRYAGSRRSVCVYDDTMHLDLNERSTAEYIAWQRCNGDLRHYVTAVSPLPDGECAAGLSVHYGAAAGPASARDRSLLSTLLPHFARAVELGFTHAEKLTEAYWDGLLKQQQEPCVLVGEDGKILRSTTQMEKLLEEGDGLTSRDGRLATSKNATICTVELLLASIAKGARRSVSCRAERPSGKSPYVVTSYPLLQDARFLGPREAVALITVVDPASPPPPRSSPWAEAFALSPRESEIATLLMHGHSISSAAESLRISEATGRVHLRNLFSKTGVSRQSALVRLLVRV